MFYCFKRLSAVNTERTQTKTIATDSLKGNKVYNGHGLKLSYPDTWVTSQDEFRDSLPTGFKTLFYIHKPNLSNDPSAQDEPTKNLVLINVNLLPTTKGLLEIINDSKNQVGFDFQTDLYIKKEGTLIGHEAYYLYDYTHNTYPDTLPYPTYILLRKSPNEVFIISIAFYDVGTDLTYSKETADEINEILASIEIAEK